MPTSAVVVKRKRQAKRARARQRARYDLRDRYRQGDLPAASRIGVMTIEHPYRETVLLPPLAQPISGIEH
jgi:hypothetical protein